MTVAPVLTARDGSWTVPSAPMAAKMPICKVELIISSGLAKGKKMQISGGASEKFPVGNSHSACKICEVLSQENHGNGDGSVDGRHGEWIDDTQGLYV